MKYSQIITGLVPLCAAALSFVGCSSDAGSGGTGGSSAAGQTHGGGTGGSTGGTGGSTGGTGGSTGGTGGTGGSTGGTGGSTGGTGGSTGGTGGSTGGTGGSTGGTGGSTGGAGGSTGGAGGSTGGAGGSTGGAGGSTGGVPAGGMGMGGTTGGRGGMFMGGSGRAAGGMGMGGTTGGRGGMGAAGSGTGGSGGSGTCGTATAKPCPPTEANSIAYIGCSMAENIGNGYKAVSGKIMWNSDSYGTGAQCVPQWVEGGSAWPGFDSKLKAIGGASVVKAIMVQICIISVATDDQVKSMIKAARAKLPDAHIYLVGQPQYANGHTCDIAGGQEATTEAQAKKLGPDTSIDSNMSYLGTFTLNCDNGECADSCHANSKGEQSLGNQAKAFWGG